MRHPLRHHHLLLFGLLLGCMEAPGSADQDAVRAPADGQTGLGPHIPLLLSGVATQVPDRYPLGQLIEVIDAVNDQPVPGYVVRQGADVLFVPEAPWKPDHLYAWIVEPPSEPVRGPELDFPEHLAGLQHFDTGDHLEILGAGLDDRDLPCFVLSRPARMSDYTGLELHHGEDSIPAEQMVGIRPEHWQPDFERHELDPGIDVKCVLTDAELEVGQELSLSWAGEGPWDRPLEAHVADVVRELYGGLP